MKKLVCAILAALMCLTLFSACQTPPSESKSAEPSVAPIESQPEYETPKAGLDAIKQTGIIKIGVSKNSPSFSILNTNTGEYEGLEVDLAYELAGKVFGVSKEKAKQNNLALIVPVADDERAAKLESGELDAVIDRFSATEERAKKINFSIPYYVDNIMVMAYRNSDINSLEDLNGKTVVIISGSSTKADVENYIKEQGLFINITFIEKPLEEFNYYKEAIGSDDTANMWELSDVGDALMINRSAMSGIITALRKDTSEMVTPPVTSVEPYTSGEASPTHSAGANSFNETSPTASQSANSLRESSLQESDAIVDPITDPPKDLLPVYGIEPFLWKQYAIATRIGQDDLFKLTDELIGELLKSGELDKMKIKWAASNL